MLTVEKIGGTSMSQFKDVLANIVKLPGDPEFRYGRIFVVSAYAGVTNMLLEDKKTRAGGVYTLFVTKRKFDAQLEELRGKLIAINEGFAGLGLDLEEANRFITDRMSQAQAYLRSMSEVVASGYVNEQNINLAARELLASIGEAHSAFNTVNILRNNGIDAVLMDLTGINDPDRLTIDQRIVRSLGSIDYRTKITVATGYVKGTEGIMREFDRGYSEITFAKIAVQVQADEAIIHKEFHLSSADPKIVGEENAVIVGNTNYDVADQLADIGMEAIHPKASKPIEKAGVDLRIKNTFDPAHPGTLINKSYIGPEAKIEIIAGSDKVVVIEIHDSNMVGQVGFDLGVMEIFRKHNISYIAKATNANSISLVIWEKEATETFVSELSDRYEVVTVKKVAVICLIGSNISKPGVLGRSATLLAQEGINIECVSQSLRQVNIQFVIDRPSYERAITVMNRELCAR
jgi:aspartate kinase